MKNFTLKFLTVFIIATMLLSTVSMAAEGNVNVINYNDKVFVDAGYKGNFDSPSDSDKAKWATLNLADFASLGLTSNVESAESVLNKFATGTDKNAKIITAYIIPKAPVTSFSFNHDDGIKVFISNQDGSPLVSESNWKLTGETTTTINVALEVNKVYPIRIEYFDWGGTEVLKTSLPMNVFHDSVPTYAVTYDYEIADVKDDVVNVVHGLTATNIVPKANPGFVFKGWKLGESLYDFSTPVIAPITLTAVWEKDINLWVSVDDMADGVYVNGKPVTNIPFSTTQEHWKNVASTYVNLEGDTTPFVAAKAVDLKQVIAGFNLVLRADKANSTDADSFVQTTTDWWYYVGTAGPGVDTKGLQWFEEGYQAAQGWFPVSAVTPHANWAIDTNFPVGATNNVWIWSAKYLDTEELDIETPVYLRSAKPATPPVVVKYTVIFDAKGGTPTPATLTDIVSGSKISEPAVDPSKSGFNFTGWDFDFETGTITENKTITAQYTPVVKEEDPKDVPDVVIPTVVNYNLTVISTEGGSVPIFEGTNTFASGTTVNLSVIAEEGYVFTGWTGAVTNNVVVMNESKTVTANFALIVVDEDVAEAADTTDEVLSTDVTSDVEETPASILDETTPEEVVETLPDTSGVAAPIFYVFGSALAGLGLTLKKRKN